MASFHAAPITNHVHPRILFTTKVDSAPFTREVQRGGQNHVQTVVRTTKRYLTRPSADATKHQVAGLTWYERNGAVPDERVMAERRAVSLRLNPPRRPQRLRLTMPRPRRLRLTSPRHPEPQEAALQAAVARLDMDSRRDFLLSPDAPQMPMAIPQWLPGPQSVPEPEFVSEPQMCPEPLYEFGYGVQTSASHTSTQTLGCRVGAQGTRLRLRGGASVR